MTYLLDEEEEENEDKLELGLGRGRGGGEKGGDGWKSRLQTPQLNQIRTRKNISSFVRRDTFRRKAKGAERQRHASLFPALVLLTFSITPYTQASNYQ